VVVKTLNIQLSGNGHTFALINPVYTYRRKEMEWMQSSVDINGIKTIYPPKPQDMKKLPQCSYCGTRCQFLHFFSEILQLLKPDDIIPHFCSVDCAKFWVYDKNHEEKEPAKKIFNNSKKGLDFLI
jgi:hypothetical protein